MTGMVLACSAGVAGSAPSPQSLPESYRVAQLAASAPSKADVVVFSTNCPLCRDAKKYLKERGVTFTDHDIEKDESAKEEFKRLNGRGVPVILVGAKRLNGFSRNRLEQVLREAGY
jgi:glutaredoxin